jgi:hypothetical protein
MMGGVAPLSTTRSLTGLSLSLLLGTTWWLSSWLLISRPVFFLRVPHGPEWDDVTCLTKLIPRKVNRIRQAYKDRLPSPAGSSETGEQKLARIRVRDTKFAKAKRRVSQRMGVCDSDLFLMLMD